MDSSPLFPLDEERPFEPSERSPDIVGGAVQVCGEGPCIARRVCRDEVVDLPVQIFFLHGLPVHSVHLGK